MRVPPDGGLMRGFPTKSKAALSSASALLRRFFSAATFQKALRLCGSGACSVGIHKWDHWEYTVPTACDEHAQCLRCSKPGHRVRHDLGEWHYVSATSCVQDRLCRHCGASSSRTVHVWGAWAFAPHDQAHCLASRTCTRCGQHESSLASHTWGPWRETPMGDARACVKCGTVQHTNEHDWGPWREWKHWLRRKEDPIAEALSGGDERTCRRCGKQERYPDHDWRPWKALFSDEEGVKCSRCGKIVKGVTPWG